MRFIILINKYLKGFILGSVYLPKILRYAFALILVAIIGLLSLSLIGLFNSTGSGHNHILLINANFLLLAFILVLFIRYCLYIFIYRRHGLAKIKLNSRLAGVFAVLTIIPGVAVLCFSLLFINTGVETWFSSRVTDSLDNSLKVAQAYLQEHEERLLIEAKTLSKDPIFSAPTFLIDAQALNQILNEEQFERDLAEISLYDKNGNLVEFAGDLIPDINANDINQLFNNFEDKKGVIFKEHDANRITAIAKLPLDTGYLVLRRWIHPAVLYYLDSTQKAYQEYYQLRSEREQVKLLFSLIFILFSISLLSGAVYFSVRLARRIVHPIENLVEGTGKIARGRLNTQLEVLDDDEIGELTNAFNSMTSEISKQQIEIRKRHREIKNKSKTLEAILTAVSSGVMTINNKGVVISANKAATQTLQIQHNDNIKNYSVEMFEMIQKFFSLNNPYSFVQNQLTIEFEDTAKEFLIRIVSLDISHDKIKTVLITFDDITELHTAQKLGAWSDVARRLAHEIKNPLTPIQLSAERIRRRFGKQINQDEELFNDLTSIIIRQVEDLRSMVNEFSDFARMPSPQFEQKDLLNIIKNVVLLQNNRKNIEINLQTTEQNMPINCDELQLKRVFTNLLENSINAIEENNKNSQGTIDIVAKIAQNRCIQVKIMDNGPGISNDIDISKLFDPYITTRKKGTGLGLAIVKKIIDEHKGSVSLLRRKPTGTVVSMIFPLD